MFVKRTLMFLVLIMLTIGAVSAALYFGFSGDVIVESPFDTTTFQTEINVICTQYDITGITNNANNPILVELITSGGTNVFYRDIYNLPLSDLDEDGKPELIIPPGGTDIKICSWYENIITTELTIPDGVDFVSLTSKDNNYVPNGDMTGYVIYEESSPDFNFCVKAEDLQTSTEYGLIYYVDQSSRFENWGGVYPSKTIVTLTSGEKYNGYNVYDTSIFAIGTTTLGHDLPHFGDSNAYTVEHDYRGKPDFYADATGAKLWLVPADDLNSDPAEGTTQVILKSWTPSTYLFENELVNYED